MPSSKKGDGVGFWKAKMLRITAFPTKTTPLGSRDFWSELGIGESETQEKSKVSVTNQGPFNENWLIVANAGTRIDWLYVPTPTNEQIAEFLDVGEFEEACGSFLGLLTPWFENSGLSLNRLAFGAVLNHSVSDRYEGYSAISAYLPFDLDAETSRDFSYQINRPANSRLVNNIQINRLGQWSVAAMATVRGDALLNLSPLTNPFESENASFACEVTLDINTVPQAGLEIDGAMTKLLLEEFMEIGELLAEKGDNQ